MTFAGAHRGFRRTIRLDLVGACWEGCGQREGCGCRSGCEPVGAARRTPTLLGWTALGWTGLGWPGPGWAGLDRAGPVAGLASTAPVIHPRRWPGSGSGAGVGGAADAGGGGGAGGQAGGGDGLAAGGAGAVAALVQAAQGRVDLVEVLAGPLQQRGGVLTLERDRRALGVVLVVAVGRLGGLDDAGPLALQAGQPVKGLAPVLGQPTPGQPTPGQPTPGQPPPAPPALGIRWRRHQPCIADPPDRAGPSIRRMSVPSGRLGPWRKH